MADRLVAFVNELDQNPDLQEKYKKNPKDVAQSYGVDEKDLAILLSNDMDAIQGRFEMEGLKSIIKISHLK